MDRVVMPTLLAARKAAEWNDLAVLVSTGVKHVFPQMPYECL